MLKCCSIDDICEEIKLSFIEEGGDIRNIKFEGVWLFQNNGSVYSKNQFSAALTKKRQIFVLVENGDFCSCHIFPTTFKMTEIVPGDVAYDIVSEIELIDENFFEKLDI